MKDRTPQEAWSNVKPSVEHLTVWGCLTHTHVPKQPQKDIADTYQTQPINAEDQPNIEQQHEENQEEDFQSNLTGGSNSSSTSSENTSSSSGISGNGSSSPDATNVRQRRTHRAPVWMEDYIPGEGLHEEEVNIVQDIGEQDPFTYQVAVKHKKWKNDMDAEIESIVKNNTWTLSSRQQKNRKRMEVVSVRCKVSISTGRIRAPMAWYSKIEIHFVKEGFQKCRTEQTLFTKRRAEGRFIIVIIYIDDLVCTREDEELIADFKASMLREFDMTDLGVMFYFLGIEVI
ncbi:hypothetical protein LIER_37516 [Lithospermum erythrorhizon]|uniref:Reverse transcriptase Ty1/copia-type domain-containing protein n=1 Tax=Lithospermum erythrorhizon TaxID=34254 RepID=A0AAV3PPC6_LITER